MVKRIKLRTLLIGGCITLLFAILITRIFFIQVVNGDFWHEYAVEKWSKEDTITATRGTIMDRNGDALAIEAPAYTVTVNPKVIHENGNEDEVVEGLHEILGKDKDELLELVTAKNKEGEYRTSREIRLEGLKISQEKKDKVDILMKEIKTELKKNKSKVADSGIALIKEQKRYYPKDSLAAHILGYVDRDGKAITGLESYNNTELSGTNGYINYQSDGQSDKLPNAQEVYQPAINGKNFKLTIDDTIQYYIEVAMKEAFAKYNPISMTVIAADPNTMEILGMANMPTFNPNSYWDAEPEDFRNHAIKSVYEPGSTFKIVTLAGAIEEKLIKPTDTYLSGGIRIKGTKTTLHDQKRAGWGTISYLEGVKRSSNVAFVKMGFEMLGKERLLNYINNFGFGNKTGIEMAGESTWPINLPGNVEVATASYGHGVLVTPIQQITAISAIANGGKLLEPHIIKEKHDPNTGNIEVFKPKVVRQVISAETAKATGTYLEQVVADQEIGTGRHAYIDGYRVAGKTGTAVKSINGKYDYDKSVVSFVGYAPVNDPKIAVVVIIDEPNDGNVGGGTAAAPVFKQIVSQSLQYMNVPKVISGDTKNDKQDSKKTSTTTVTPKSKAPEVVGKTVEAAKNELLNTGVAYVTLGKGNKVIRQYPAKSTIMSSGQRIYLLTEDSNKMEVPDLKGESLRDALQVLTLMKLTVNVEGEGYVTEQKVLEAQGKRTVQLTLKPPNDLVDDIVQEDKSKETE